MDELAVVLEDNQRLRLENEQLRDMVKAYDIDKAEEQHGLNDVERLRQERDKFMEDTARLDALESAAKEARVLWVEGGTIEGVLTGSATLREALDKLREGE